MLSNEVDGKRCCWYVGECKGRARILTSSKTGKKMMKVQERWRQWGAFYKVHFQAVSPCENLLPGSIMQDSVVRCPEWIVLIQMNMLHLIKSM